MNDILKRALEQIDQFNGQQYRALIEMGLAEDSGDPWGYSEDLLVLQLAFKLQPPSDAVDPLDRIEKPSVDEYLARLGDRIKAVMATQNVEVTA